MTKLGNFFNRMKAISRLHESRSGIYDFNETGEFIKYWFQLPKMGLISDKSKINPRNIMEQLPNVIILDLGSGTDCRIRLIGTGITGRWGFDPTNSNFLDLIAPQNRDAIADHMAILHKQPCGVILLGDEHYTSGQMVRSETVLLPVHSGHNEANTLFGLITSVASHMELDGDIMAAAFYNLTNIRFINIGAGVPV
ncbi:MAG: PAS domain-containing protein [Pseudomonadota bacterium]